MGFLMGDSKMIATHYLLCKGAILLALLRWVLSRAVKLRDRAAIALFSRATTESLRSRSSPSRVPSELAADGLPLATTYEDVTVKRLQASCDTCAVCFSPLVEGDEVRVLRNCRHVYHRECLDRWVGCDPDQHHDHDRRDDHSNHRTCPLCRAPLWARSQSSKLAGTEPRWSVKRLCSSVW